MTPTPVQLNDYPSVSQWVTTVGGTVLYWNGLGDTGATPATRYLEYSWTFTGGGTSDFVSAPSWQQSLAFHTQTQSAPGVTQPCAANWHNPPNAYPAGTWCRGIPDVAAQSGDVLTNGYVAGGGTSLSSPLWLGMWTRIQAASSNPGRLGFATAAIYANNADAIKWANDFFDIGSATSPSNADGGPTTAPTCSGLTAINACSKPGWDYLSGWGTPKVTNLMKDLNNGNTNPTPFVPNNIPETPLVFLLPLGGIAVIGAVAFDQRRRRRATA
jgi:subtilase family serine protease